MEEVKHRRSVPRRTIIERRPTIIEEPQPIQRLRFKSSLEHERPRSYIGHHHIIMLLQIPGIVLLSILLAGCSSYSTMTNVYVLALSYSNASSSYERQVQGNLSATLGAYKGVSQLEVRGGYFGLCVHQHGVVWLCSADASGLARQIGPENDPLDLIGAMSQFKDNTIFSGLLFMAIVIIFITAMLLATLPGWHLERHEADMDIKPVPILRVVPASLACSAAASGLLLVAALWQHVGSVGAAAMADITYYGNVKTDIGANAMIMAWVSFGLSVFSTFAVLITVLAIVMLNRSLD